MQTKRIFLAIALPLEVQQELARIIALLQKKHVCEGNYINPYRAHVTIQFIGSIAEDAIAAMHTALQTITYTVFKASLYSLGFFEKKGHIAIIYINIKSDELQSFAVLVQRAVAPWLVHTQEQFVGHITLLRVKKMYDVSALRSFLMNTKVEPISWTVNSLFLMESVLTPEGPIYTPLHEYPLAISR